MNSSWKEQYPSGSDQSSPYQDLEDGVCLLALITDRQQDLEPGLPPFKDLNRGNTSLEHTSNVGQAERSYTVTENLHDDSNGPFDGIEELEDWTSYLNQQSTRFARMVKERRRKHHFHAEIHVLLGRDVLLSQDERKQTHPYIGCSRRCCWLCYAFVLLHGGFETRGTHGTIMHRWDILTNTSIHEGCVTEF